MRIFKLRFSSFTNLLGHKPSDEFLVARKIKSIRNLKPAKEFPVNRSLNQKVIAYSTAESYDGLKLYRLISQKYTMKPYIADNIFHFELSKDGGEAFMFTDGGFVAWSATESQCSKLLSQVQQYEENHFPVESEIYDFVIDEQSQTHINSDTLVLGNDLELEQAKLVYSAGMFRSVKLASLEILLDNHLSKNKEISDILLVGKSVPISQQRMLQNLGELFKLRAQVNLNSDMLDLPEFCWTSPEMEVCFNEMSKNLDVRPRIAIFNKKLDYANEVAEFFRNHMHEQKSMKLEWIIIILIGVEIVFSTLHYLER